MQFAGCLHKEAGHKMCEQPGRILQDAAMYACLSKLLRWCKQLCCTCHNNAKCGVLKSVDADIHSTNTASCKCHVQVLMLLEERS